MGGWFNLHRAIATIAVFFMVGGVLIVALNSDFSFAHSDHGKQGLALVIIVGVQVILAVFQPGHEKGIRIYWTWLHRFTAVVILLFGFVQTGDGIKHPLTQINGAP